MCVSKEKHSIKIKSNTGTENEFANYQSQYIKERDGERREFTSSAWQDYMCFILTRFG